MSYDDERPADWSTYDRVATAAADLKWLMFEMHGSKEDLLSVLGPNNYERVREYLDCIAINVTKMGRAAVALAAVVMEKSTDPVAIRVLGRVRARMDEGDVNGAWNHVEAWLNGREIAEDEA